MENLNEVNASTEEVVTPQETAQVETDTGVEGEVAATQSEEKHVQTPEENAKFAEVRRKAEREAEDRVYATLYGDEYGIKSKADYEAYMANLKEQELLESLQEEGADSELIKEELKKQWEATDPRLQEYNALKAETYIKSQIEELNNDLSETGIDVTVKTIEDLDKLPNSERMAQLIESGKTLAEAYFLANKKDIIARQAEKVQQETIKKIQANAESTPGSLADNGQTTQLYTREQVDNMSVDEINRNYEIVMKSMKTWK